MVANHYTTGDVVPANYSELHRVYYGYVVGLVGNLGIEDQSREDVASEILLRFIERDFLNVYDPTKTFTHEGRTYTARFKPFLSGFVRIYVRGHRDRQRRRMHHELMINDQFFGAMEDSNANHSWFDVVADMLTDDMLDVEDRMVEEVMVRRLRAQLATVPRRNKRDRCDLVALFDAIMDQVHTNGQCSVKELQAAFDVTSTSIHSWLNWMRMNLEDVR